MLYQLLSCSLCILLHKAQPFLVLQEKDSSVFLIIVSPFREEHRK